MPPARSSRSLATRTPRRSTARRRIARSPLSGAAPGRTLLAVALGGSTLFVAWGLVARDATQIPTLAAGLAVYGLVFSALAIAGLAATLRAARAGEGGRAFAAALLGGLALVVAAGSFGLSLVLSLLLGAG